MAKRNSYVSRSVYQKLAEENKRLKKDIKTLIVGKDELEKKEVFMMYLEHFSKIDIIENFIYDAIKRSENNDNTK